MTSVICRAGGKNGGHENYGKAHKWCLTNCVFCGVRKPLDQSYVEITNVEAGGYERWLVGDFDNLVFDHIDAVRGSTCHEIAAKLNAKNNYVGKALGRLHVAGRISHLTSKRDGESMVAKKVTMAAELNQPASPTQSIKESPAILEQDVAK